MALPGHTLVIGVFSGHYSFVIPRRFPIPHPTPASLSIPRHAQPLAVAWRFSWWAGGGWRARGGRGKPGGICCIRGRGVGNGGFAGHGTASHSHGEGPPRRERDARNRVIATPSKKRAKTRLCAFSPLSYPDRPPLPRPAQSPGNYTPVIHRRLPIFRSTSRQLPFPALKFSWDCPKNELSMSYIVPLYSESPACPRCSRCTIGMPSPAFFPPPSPSKFPGISPSLPLPLSFLTQKKKKMTDRRRERRGGEQ